MNHYTQGYKYTALCVYRFKISAWLSIGVVGKQILLCFFCAAAFSTSVTGVKDWHIEFLFFAAAGVLDLLPFCFFACFLRCFCACALIVLLKGLFSVLLFLGRFLRLKTWSAADRGAEGVAIEPGFEGGVSSSTTHVRAWAIRNSAACTCAAAILTLAVRASLFCNCENGTEPNADTAALPAPYILSFSEEQSSKSAYEKTWLSKMFTIWLAG